MLELEAVSGLLANRPSPDGVVEMLAYMESSESDHEISRVN